MKRFKIPTRQLALAAIIAALYAALTILFAPFSFGEIQVRISEALTVLPLFTPAAIPGLFIGCLIGNIYSGNIFDIIFGSLTTLAAAFLTYKTRKSPWFAMCWPVVLNGISVGFILKYAYGVPLPLLLLMLYVAIGQTIAVYAIGGPLQLLFKRNPKWLEWQK